MTLSLNKKTTLGTILYFLFFAIIMVGKGLGLSQSSATYITMTWIAIVFVLFKVIFTNYTRNELIVCFFLNVLGIIVWRCSGNAGPLLCIVAVTAAKDIKFDNILKWNLAIRGTLYILRTSLAIMGVIDIQKMYTYMDTNSYRTRYALGYSQPNATHYELFVIVVSLVLLFKHKVKFWHYIALFLYNYFIFSYTDSRTGFIMTTFFLLVSLFVNTKLFGVVYKVVKAFADKSFIIITVLSFALAIMFNKIAILSTFGTFSSRFSVGLKVISNNALSLFGADVDGGDLAFVNFVYGDGILFVVVLLVAYYILLKKYTFEKHIYLMIACCAYAIYSISEAYTDSATMNITIYALAAVLFHNKELLNSKYEKIDSDTTPWRPN